MKYRLTAQVTISLSTIVEAKNREEALAIARDRDLTSIIDQGADERMWVTSGELDGTPTGITIEET